MLKYLTHYICLVNAWYYRYHCCSLSIHSPPWNQFTQLTSALHTFCITKWLVLRAHGECSVSKLLLTTKLFWRKGTWEPQRLIFMHSSFFHISIVYSVVQLQCPIFSYDRSQSIFFYRLFQMGFPSWIPNFYQMYYY